MSDPELAARAQRAAVRLEQSWERWRRLHGLNNEPSQPISSYVGYSLVEPWGRPRVVFGVGAEEAEQLSALLESDERADPRYNQGLLWEAEVPAQARPSDSQPIERAAQGRVQAEHNERSDRTERSGRAERSERSGRAERSERAERGAPGEWGRTGFQEPVAAFQEPVAAFSAAPVCETEAPRREPVPDLVADLAGWSSGELPGQASAGLAAWPGAKAEAERQVAGAAQREAAAVAQRQAAASVQRQPARSADRVEPQSTPEMGQSSNSPEPTGWLRLA